ncbi:hypothetical protein QUC31_016900 [Theobroma cacao]
MAYFVSEIQKSKSRWSQYSSEKDMDYKYRLIPPILPKEIVASAASYVQSQAKGLIPPASIHCTRVVVMIRI